MHRVCVEGVIDYYILNAWGVSIDWYAPNW